MLEAQTIFSFIIHCHFGDAFCREGTAEVNNTVKGMEE
jgi:hypothetical protein